MSPKRHLLCTGIIPVPNAALVHRTRICRDMLSASSLLSN